MEIGGFMEFKELKKMIESLVGNKEYEKVKILSKTECIDQIKKGKVKEKRIYHKGYWEEKINCHLK